MPTPLNQPATQLEILATRAMVTALGKALVKKGVISHSEIASEMSSLIQGAAAVDPLLEAEMKIILGSIVTW